MNNKIIITGVGIFGSALLWLLSFKIIAVLLGPSGVAIYSQLRQIVQATGTAATFGGGSTIVQGLSENSDTAYRQKFRGTITIIIFTIVSLITIGIISCAPFVAQHMLSNDTKEAVVAIQLLSVGIFLNTGTMYLMAVLNGYQSLKSLAAIQITTPLFIVTSLFLTSFVPHVNTYIMLASLFVIGSAFGFVSALVASQKTANYALPRERTFLSKEEVLIFIRFSSATLIAALASSLTMLFVRAQIISAYGLHQAGLFDASWTLTFNYITLFLTACSILYLPRLSQAKDKRQQMYYLQSTCYIVIACVTLITYLIIIFKSQFLHLLYSQEFSTAEKSLHILAAAILIRSVSWVMSVLMVATKDSVTILVSELFVNFLLIALTYWASNNYSTIDAVAWGLFATNIIYFLWMLFYVKQKNKLLHVKGIFVLLSLGVFFIVALFLIQQTPNGYMLNDYPWVQNIIFLGIALTIAFISWCALQNLRSEIQLSTQL